MAWRKEVRTEFDDPQAAALIAKAADPMAYTMSKLKARLEEYDFPALITAEWGQEERLFRLYDDPKTPVARKVKLISLFGELFSVQAVPRLVGWIERNGPHDRQSLGLGSGKYRPKRHDSGTHQDDAIRHTGIAGYSGESLGNRRGIARRFHDRGSLVGGLGNR